MRLTALLQVVGLILYLGNGHPSPAESDSTSRELVESNHAPNTCSNRACWFGEFNINTDYEVSCPDTGVTRRYDFVVSEYHKWIGGDGKAKEVAMLVNGQYPGPVVRANWGDWIEIHVTNNLTCDGTSMHWHGIHMRRNAVNDGANGVTECPIPPGVTKTYRFRAEQYGTGWYHSHYSSQYANGLAGSIQIEGPASFPYDEDLGVFPIGDWYYGDAEKLARELVPPPGLAPKADNVLFNGTHVNKDGGGSHYRVILEPGKRHRLRLINPSVDTSFSVSLVDHDMTVIATDFVPIHPFITSSVFLVPGQRLDVAIDASNTPGNYWFNATLSGLRSICGGLDSAIPRPAAIFSYANAPDISALPTILGGPPSETFCQDNTDFVPVISRDVDSSTFFANEDNTMEVAVAKKAWQDVPDRIYWNVHGTDMNLTWEKPTLEYIAAGDFSFPEKYNVHTVPNSNSQWSYWLIESIGTVPHPMHLHGHDFHILGHSDPPIDPETAPFTPFDPATDTPRLRFNNAPRRDTTMLPAKGWLALAFVADNPGAWLLHCHIAWHAGQGLSLQFIERITEIPSTVQLSQIEPMCTSWKDYYRTSQCKQWDSGI